MAKKLAKERKIRVKNNILTKNIFILLKNKLIESLQISQKNTLWYKNLDKKRNNNFKDNIKLIYDNKNILNIDIFIKLIKIAQNFNNFENYKTLFLHSFFLFI